MKRLYLIPVFALLALGLFAGCGSEVDDDWTPVDVSETKHEFGAISNHGMALVESNYEFTNCTECHGEDLHGLALGDPDNPVRSCFECHSNTNHNWVFEGNNGDGFASWGGHVQWMQNNEWAMDGCQVCHDINSDMMVPSGVNFGANCTECHTSSSGPLACNTCHGEMDDDANSMLSWVNGEAHAAHLSADASMFAANFTCQTCHSRTTALDDVDHYNDSTPGSVEVVFGGIASGTWDGTSQTCSNVYCHGGDADWTLQNVVFDCTSCHGAPPASHLPTYTNCGDCHSTVDASDPSAIAIPSQHINGTVDF